MLTSSLGVADVKLQQQVERKSVLERKKWI